MLHLVACGRPVLSRNAPIVAAALLFVASTHRPARKSVRDGATLCPNSHALLPPLAPSNSLFSHSFILPLRLFLRIVSRRRTPKGFRDQLPQIVFTRSLLKNIVAVPTRPIVRIGGGKFKHVNCVKWWAEMSLGCLIKVQRIRI